MQITIDFDKLATNVPAATRILRQRLERAQLAVVDIACDGKIKRTAGVSFREVVVTFTDNQTLTLRVKSTGDVYQVAVNGKVTPVFAQGGMDEAIAELAGILDRSRAAMQKRLAAIKVKPPEGIKTAAPKLEVTLRQQISEVDQQIGEAEKELAELQAQ